MNSFLRSLTATQQIGALFLVVFGILSMVTAWAFVRNLREHASDDPEAEARQQQARRFWSLLKTSWGMATVFWVGWVLGDTVATVLFAIVGFFALREFITLSPTRRGDHRSLVLAFFVVLPMQFTLVGTRHFDLFTVFIPVYVFLALPVVSALANDPQRFLERNAKLQWGIMVCVYGMSHVPALLLLDFPGYRDKGAFLVFFLVFVVQTCMVVQHLLGRRFPHKPVAPQVSQSFQWLSWLAGVASGGLAGGLLTFITPFKPGQALGMALLASFAGSLGHLVMKALKRDRGITSWGMQGQSVTGAGGLLDRVDALCFAAPVFFHSVRWYFGL
ncbi:MAG: phosphatidate cytidylyltransferase [Acidovorax sp.]|uniref:phosphatidate cytidylyltransferase n=1 Tax=Acidovorax sp. TaxID=1872122 RepID=UPI0039E465B2